MLHHVAKSRVVPGHPRHHPRSAPESPRETLSKRAGFDSRSYTGASTYKISTGKFLGCTPTVTFVIFTQIWSSSLSASKFIWLRLATPLTLSSTPDIEYAGSVIGPNFKNAGGGANLIFTELRIMMVSFYNCVSYGWYKSTSWTFVGGKLPL